NLATRPRLRETAMLHIDVGRGVRHCDGLTRRELLRVGAIGLGGLTLPNLLRQQAVATTGRKATAKSVILLFLSGGPSELDMRDLKPGAPAEARGRFQPIATNVAGMQISEHLPRAARQADKYAILRAVHHTSPNHPAAAYWMMIGSPMQRVAPQVVTMSREDRPHPGSVVAKLLGARHGIPAFVMVPEAISPVRPGGPGKHAAFPAAPCAPSRVNSAPTLPDYPPGALDPDLEVTHARLEARRALLGQISQQARAIEKAAATQAFDP